MSKKVSVGVIGALFMALVHVPVPSFAQSNRLSETHRHTFSAPIDAVSVGLFDQRTRSAEIRGQFSNGSWTDWKRGEIDDDSNPGITETDLMLFPQSVKAIEVRSATKNYVVHPLRINRAPARVLTTSRIAVAQPKILSRSQWGADDSFLFSPTTETTASDISGDNGTTPSNRIDDCLKAQQQYPDEFMLRDTITKDASGQTYRWPVQHSPQIRLLVVHHTALAVAGEARSGVERMRALYQYHSNSRGWGDIGYNYVIDEQGQIYEGRTGGRFAVGGHAYCNNIGSIGISLMGNFEIEQPTQSQVQSLQWLLRTLATEYGIDPRASVQFHGKKFLSPVAMHKDLVSTTCPGYYLHGAIGQVIANVQNNNLFASVTFPALRSEDAKKQQIAATGTVAGNQITIVGRTTVSLNPGGKQRISFSVSGGESGIRANRRIATVTRSVPSILLWQEEGGQQFEVASGLALPYDLPAGESTVVSLIVQAPWDSGSYTFDIGMLHYTLAVSGRRTRTAMYISPFSANPATVVPQPTRRTIRSTINTTATMQRLELRQAKRNQLPVPPTTSSSIGSGFPTRVPSEESRSQNIRIRLSLSTQKPVVRFPGGGTVGSGLPTASGQRVTIEAKNGVCAATSDAGVAGEAALRLTPDPGGFTTIEGIVGKTRTYRGVIECRVIGGNLVFINELPLEHYLRGLAEEPDTEPIEKQRAFAVAARTYALYYTDPQHRKFAGQPYDGDDSPTNFQAYSGVDFETANPQWIKAVIATAGEVLTYQGEVLKVPYFSSDDGRTRSPTEAGWKDFPFADVFASKPDPWCAGLALRGHGVGMSGCGALAQAKEGKTYQQILQYYYPGTVITGGNR